MGKAILITAVIFLLLASCGGGFGLFMGLIGGLIGLITGIIGAAFGIVAGILGALVGVTAGVFALAIPFIAIALVIAGIVCLFTLVSPRHPSLLARLNGLVRKSRHYRNLRRILPYLFPQIFNCSIQLSITSVICSVGEIVDHDIGFKAVSLN